jgi:hypothetical protein
MKHSFIVLLVAFMAMMSMEANAQGLVYTPFIPQQSSSADFGSWGSDSGYSRQRSGGYRPSYQTQTIRSTAYYVNYDGDYQKVPIRVEYTVYSNGATSLTVAEQWKGNGLGGQWEKVLSAAYVRECQSIFANGPTAELERTFMYKAMVGTSWYYFDL